MRTRRQQVGCDGVACWVGKKDAMALWHHLVLTLWHPSLVVSWTIPSTLLAACLLQDAGTPSALGHTEFPWQFAKGVGAFSMAPMPNGAAAAIRN
jgi:hypothetical protein